MLDQTGETDGRPIALLAENARMPVADLARRLGIAHIRALSRLDRLEAHGLIADHTLRRGPELRRPFRARVRVSTEPRAGPDVLTRRRQMPEVVAVHTTSGRVDLIATVSADTPRALDRTRDENGAARGTS